MRSTVPPLVVLAVAMIALCGCASGSAERDLDGEVWMSLDGSTCRDAAGLSVEEGTSVVILDLAGEELDVARLTDKREREDDGACVFGFQLSEIPTTESGYDVVINQQHWRLNRTDLDAGQWGVDIFDAELSRRWAEDQDTSEVTRVFVFVVSGSGDDEAIAQRLADELSGLEGVVDYEQVSVQEAHAESDVRFAYEPELLEQFDEDPTLASASLRFLVIGDQEVRAFIAEAEARPEVLLVGVSMD